MMKIDKTKIISLLVGGTIIASASGYALAAQAPHSIASSNTTISQVVSTEMEVSSTIDDVASQKASSVITSEPTEASSSEVIDKSSSETDSLIVGVCYYDIFDPDTGKLIGARDVGYIS